MSEIYEFHIEGNLDPRWSEWFNGMSFHNATAGETIIRGRVRDPAELYGILNKFRDLGLTLISVNKVGEGEL